MPPTASWSWNGAQPGGEVAEKKTEGEVSIQSKRGNTIKKSAQPNDPAIHLSRPGNDVVKNASELQVDEKKSGGAKSDEKDDGEGEKGEEETNGDTGGKKRKADDEGEGNGEAKKARGRPKGAPGKGEKKAAAPAATTNGEKKARGRPKKEGGATDGAKPEKKLKKEGKAKAPPTGVGKRTRSQK